MTYYFTTKTKWYPHCIMQCSGWKHCWWNLWDI